VSEENVVIIPVYNEGSVVASVIDSVHKHFQTIICVDDGSADNSADEILRSGAVLVRHPINLGAGAATQTGIDYALRNTKAQYFITFDADGQHHTKDAVKMLSYLKKHDIDIVFGSRFLGEVVDISPAKKIFLRLAKAFSHIDTGVNLTDPHIGLRVFNRNFAENLKLTMPDYSHASEVVRRVREGNFQYAEQPVTVTYSKYSKAKGQPMLNSVNITFDLLLHRVTKR